MPGSFFQAGYNRSVFLTGPFRGTGPKQWPRRRDRRCDPQEKSPGFWALVDIWGFPKIRGTFLGVPIIRTIVFWGLYWGPLILGNYHLYRYTYNTVSGLETRVAGDVRP